MLDLHGRGDGDELASGSAPARRLQWLVRLRWYALAGIVVGTSASASGLFPGVNVPVLAVTATVAALYNLALWRSERAGRMETGPRAALTQALGDFLLLTVVLWSSGGVHSPFIGYYAFHIALAGILGGPRATLLAAAAAIGCAGFLALGESVPALSISSWDVQGPLRTATEVIAFSSTIAGIAYLVTRAVSELRDREEALARARDRARLEYEVLSTTLNELDAGLDIVDADSRVVFKNKLAQRLVPSPASGEAWHCPGGDHGCERDVSGICPLDRSLRDGEAGRCRFAVRVDASERVYELHSFPLASAVGDGPKVMNLYVDRTSAVLAERQLVLAERLSSLGRIAQGVAHELNTPLATIRTLAADMGAALTSLRSQLPATGEALLTDLGESAALIREETGRLGRITHSLLAGGDLVRARIDGAVALSAVIERGCALVLSGARRGTRVEVDPSLDAIVVVADPDRLLQVVVNLVQNAADALRDRPSGSIRISAERDSEDPSGRVAILIDDDGPGIDPAVQTRLFEPFATTKPPGEGTGLGLYTSYMLVQAMQGTLSLEASPRGGTRAAVRLPLSAAGRPSRPLVEGARA
ncbi:MAG TPA: ATP-binding protein [Polyangiales bacterium]|nr:ATP-binding protein [Polyangiales bacterium]